MLGAEARQCTMMTATATTEQQGIAPPTPGAARRGRPKKDPALKALEAVRKREAREAAKLEKKAKKQQALLDAVNEVKDIPNTPLPTPLGSLGVERGSSVGRSSKAAFDITMPASQGRTAPLSALTGEATTQAQREASARFAMRELMTSYYRQELERPRDKEKRRREEAKRKRQEMLDAIRAASVEVAVVQPEEAAQLRSRREPSKMERRAPVDSAAVAAAYSAMQGEQAMAPDEGASTHSVIDERYDDITGGVDLQYHTRDVGGADDEPPVFSSSEEGIPARSQTVAGTGMSSADALFATAADLEEDPFDDDD